MNLADQIRSSCVWVSLNTNKRYRVPIRWGFGQIHRSGISRNQVLAVNVGGYGDHLCGRGKRGALAKEVNFRGRAQCDSFTKGIRAWPEALRKRFTDYRDRSIGGNFM